MAQLKTGPVGPQLSQKDFKRLSIPEGAAKANIYNQRLKHDLDHVRYYYVDMPFTCKKCGIQEVWTVDQQRFWYEDCKGDPNAVAIHCHRCRKHNERAT